MVCLNISAGLILIANQHQYRGSQSALTPRWACTGEERLARASATSVKPLAVLLIFHSEIQATVLRSGEPGCDAYSQWESFISPPGNDQA
jgi:hypothetical protein